MARTKSQVRGAFLPSGKPIGAFIIRVQGLTRPVLAPQRQEHAIAVPEQPPTAGKGDDASTDLPQTYRRTSSFAEHNISEASSHLREHEPVGNRIDTLASSRSTKRTRTAQDRIKSELAIDGTDVLDPRKTKPATFDPNSAEEGRMRTRRSKPTRGDGEDGSKDGVPSTMPAVSTHKDSKTMDSLEVGGSGVVKDASRADTNQSEDINATNSLTAPTQPMVMPKGPVSATPSSIVTTSETSYSHVVPNEEKNGRAGLSTSGNVTRHSTPTAMESKPASRKSSRFDKELATDGTPLLQRSDLTDTNSLVTEYYDGKRWYQVTTSEKPEWAKDERVVDRRSKRINGGDTVEEPSRSSRVKRQRTTRGVSRLA